MRVTGVGACLPERVLTNAELETMVDTSDEWIRTRTGIRERRIASPGEATSHLALGAARAALQEAGLTPSELDLVVLATTSPDKLIPCTAARLQHALGADRAWGFDLNAACSGFLFALAVAASQLAAGTARRALVVGAETLSRITDWTDRNTCVLFADGAGAVVLEGGGEGGPLGLSFRLDGSGERLLEVPAGGSAQPASEETVAARLHFIKMQGREVFRLAVEGMEATAREALKESDLSPEEVDLFLPHQANLRILEAVGRRLGIPEEKWVVNIDRLGNTGAASVPLALWEAWKAGRLKPGALLLFSAFGGGFTYGSLVWRW